MRVFVYWNLHKACYSIKALDGASKGRVVAHAEIFIVRDAELRVNQKGRARVIANRRKEVHAGVVGTLEAYRGSATAQGRWAGLPSFDMWTATGSGYRQYAIREGSGVTYNPWAGPNFTSRSSGAACHAADMVLGVRQMAKACLFTFDPCQSPVAFPSN